MYTHAHHRVISVIYRYQVGLTVLVGVNSICLYIALVVISTLVLSEMRSHKVQDVIRIK